MAEGYFCLILITEFLSENLKYIGDNYINFVISRGELIKYPIDPIHVCLKNMNFSYNYEKKIDVS